MRPPCSCLHALISWVVMARDAGYGAEIVAVAGRKDSSPGAVPLGWRGVASGRARPGVRGPFRRIGARSGRVAAALPAGLDLAGGHGGDLPDRRVLPAPDHPTRPGPLAARRARSAAAGLRHPVRQLLRARRQHGRPAAVAGRRHGARAAARVLGLDAAVRLPGDASPGGGHAAVEPGRSAAVGMGLHAFRDPTVAEDFEAVRLPIDVAGFHTYAVDWTPQRARFFVDGQPVRGCGRPPAYPMQMMIAVFDFPERSTDEDAGAVPEFVVDYLRGYQE